MLPFDTTLHEAGYMPKSNAERGTDLAAVFQTLGTKANLADADGAIVLTDGGDETVELASVPSMPLAIVGVGSSPETWNDIGIGAVTAPASVEEKSQFDLEADLYARPGTHESLNALKVSLDEGHDKNWTEVQSQTVDLSSLHAAAAFHVQANGTGAQRYRVRLPELPGELTYANNTRIVNVQVQQRALHVLYFTQELGVDYKYLRTELGADPGRGFYRDVPRAGGPVHRAGRSHRLSGFGTGLSDQRRCPEALRLRDSRLVPARASSPTRRSRRWPVMSRMAAR